MASLTMNRMEVPLFERHGDVMRLSKDLHRYIG